MVNRRKYPVYLAAAMAGLCLLLVLCLVIGSYIGRDKAAGDQGDVAEAKGDSGDAADAESMVPAPEFSKESGFYKKGFKLSLTVPEGTRVYYTLDSSTPTKGSSLYKKAIKIKDTSKEPAVHSVRTDFEPYMPGNNIAGYATEVAPGWYTRNVLPDNVDKCQVVRAVAIDKKGKKSDVVTASYFIGYEDKKGYDDIAVLSLVSDPDGLFNDDTGIMVNGSLYKEKWLKGEYDGIKNSHLVRKSCNTFRGRGKEWEREVHLDFFDEDDKSLVFSQEAGIRLHGNQSRVAEPQKSFNLYARSSYDGNNTFLVPLFEDGLLQDKVTLMRGGDIRNYYLSDKMNDRTMDTQQYRMAQVFLDGEYWGMYALQEKYNSKEYIRTHYNLDKGEYTLVKGLPTGFDIKEGDPEAIRTSFREVRDYAQEKDLSVDEYYRVLCGMMDMQSFIDAYAVRLYVGDQDWSWFKNQYMLYYDHKWHWMVYDIDYGAGKHEPPDADTFTSTRMNVKYSLYNDPLFPHLMANEDFRRQFVNTYLDIGNEIYKGSRVRKDLKKFASAYKEAGILQSLRYPPVLEMNLYKNDPSYISEINKLCDDIATYFEGRMDYAPSHLAGYFSLTGKPARVTIENSTPKGGKVSINTVTPVLDEDGRWSGTYYTDFPVTLTAEPEEGWVFSGWKSKKGDLTPIDDDSSQLQFTGDVSVKAVFRKDNGKEE